MDDRIANELVTAVEKLVEKLDKIADKLVDLEISVGQLQEPLDKIAIYQHELAAKATMLEELIGSDEDRGRFIRAGLIR